MELFCAEQPLLNYLIVSSGRPYTSLHVLNHRKRLNIPLEIWAGTPGGVVEEGKIKFQNRASPLLVHWAGEWHPKKPGQNESGHALPESLGVLQKSASGNCLSRGPNE
jgi:hypothetical protein